MRPMTSVVLWGMSLMLAGLFSEASLAAAQAPGVTASEVVDRQTLKAFVRGGARAWLEASRTLPADQVEKVFREEGGYWKSGSIYLFIATDKGVMFFHGANPSLEGQDLYHLEDLNGVKIAQELLAAAAAGGGYVEYLFDDPLVEGDEDTGSPKVSYAEALRSPDFQDGRPFVIASGYYRGAVSFIPLVSSAAGPGESFFTSELTLTNRAPYQARLFYSYTAHVGGGSGTASDVLKPGEQKIVPDALAYLRSRGIPASASGDRVGTLRVEAFDSPGAGVLVRTTTAVPEGRAGLAYAGVREGAGFEEAVYVCGLRQTEQNHSDLLVQNLGTLDEGPITLRATVFSGDGSASSPRVLKDVALGPGGMHRIPEVLDSLANGYVKVERVEGTAPFFAFGVINDNVNSDGSFVFPVSPSSLAGVPRQTLPVIVERGAFTSELTVTNLSETPRTVMFSLVADAIAAPGNSATFSLALAAGQQTIIPDVISAARQQGVAGIGPPSGLAGPLFAAAADGDLSGIVIGARTGTPGMVGGGRYSLFFTAVPEGAAFSDSAWVDALRQNEENRANLALVNTGEMDDSDSVFELEIYDGHRGALVNTISGLTVAARRWHQIHGILGNYVPGTTQGYVRVRKISGNNPFLAYGVVNDGGAPGERSGDGSFVAALPAGPAAGGGGGGEPGGSGAGPLGAVEVGAGEAVHIRSLLSITGASSLGASLRNSVQLAARDFESVRGYAIEIGESLDSMCSPEGGRAGAERIVADRRVLGVVGTSCSAAAVAASPVISEAGLVMIAPSNTSPLLTSDLAGNPNSNYHPGYFRVANNDLFQGKAVADFAHRELGLRRMVAVHDGDPYTTALVSAFGDAFRALGGEVVATAGIEKGDTDMTSVLAEFLAAGPDGIFFPLFRAEGSHFARQARELDGLEGVALITGAAMLVSEFLGTPQSAGIYLAGPVSDLGGNVNVATGRNAEDLLAEFEATYGGPPNTPYWAFAYDATTLLLSAIESVAVEQDGKLTIDRAGLRQAIGETAGFQGLIGVLSCDEFGDCGTGRINIYHHTDTSITDAAQLPVVYRFSP